MKFKLGLSRRRKVPVFHIFGKTFLPHRGLHLMVRFRWLKIISETDESVILEGCGQRLRLLTPHALYVIREWDMWKKYYLPNSSLNEKTVLDVGAGCGETAFFYFLHGAKKVIAIESSIKAVECLKENARTNGWNIEIIPHSFKLEHLKIPHDFMKMDIERGERELLKFPIITKPCVVEVHNNQLKRKFERRGFMKIYSKSGAIHLMMLKNTSKRSSET